MGEQAVECITETVAFFQFVQKLFNFFSASTKRWKILTEHLGVNRVLISISETRWSAHANTINTLRNGYLNMSEALSSIAIDISQPGDTRNEAQSLVKN